MKKLLFLLVLLVFNIQAGEIIKKSSSGICHDASSSYYERTKTFTPYSTMDECLKSGGRLPGSSKTTNTSQSATKKTTASSNKYSRDKFGHGWSEGQDPSDCMNTRHEILKKMSTSTIATGKNKCTVERGKWYGVYTGKTSSPEPVTRLCYRASPPRLRIRHNRLRNHQILSRIFTGFGSGPFRGKTL